jgi:hypothetical protein
MENRIGRSISMLAILAASAAVMVAQQSGQNPYQGVSHPPADDQIVTSQNPEAKPPAGHPYAAQPSAAAAVYDPPQTGKYTAPAYGPQAPPAAPAVDASSPDGTDDGIVRVAPDPASQPGLNERAYASDPDGDIVHPLPLRPGELGEGTMIRVRLLTQLSTTHSEKDERFRSTVASDVVQDGRVVIPAGAEIAGRVAQVSTGHAGGSGSMRLQPEELNMPDGSRYRLRAQVAAAPGSGAHVVGEGTIRPDSRFKRDGIEYGGAVGAGVITGAVAGGPAGAAAGGLIGAGVITVHLLVSHPQARLESGTVLDFMLTDPLDLVPTTPAAN